jgi:DNA-binding transcriptional regulator YiaG
MHDAQVKYKLSKTQIAEIFNVDKSTVGRVLASKKKLSPKELKLMSDLI